MHHPQIKLKISTIIFIINQSIYKIARQFTSQFMCLQQPRNSISKMSSPTLILDRSTHQQQNLMFLSNKNINHLYKPLILTSLFLFLFYTLLSNRHIDQPPQFMSRLSQAPTTTSHHHHTSNTTTHSPTNISHVVIAIAGSTDAWKFRRPYLESWWKPNVTKGYIYLDVEPKKFLPWPNTTPPYRVSENTLRYKPFDKHPTKCSIRLFRVIAETFRETHDQGIRWYVMTDDDTILFIDNLVDVLQKYDHTKYFYIGESSESTLSNFENTYEMAFGGGGYAISYPLAEALAKNVDECIKRYPDTYGSDHLMQSCVADMGVPLTHEKGFHQIDLHGDLLGFLSSHPQAPLVSLHHLEVVEPYFPFMKRLEALNHLMKAGNADQSRLLQQTICYDKTKKWSYSIAWGYTVQMYERIIPPSVLEKPLETFLAWRKPPKHPFMFNTRWLSRHPCDIPHVFYLENVENFAKKNRIVTTYVRRTPRKVRPCWRPPPGNYTSAFPGDITKIVVVSPANKYPAQLGTRRECCDLQNQVEKNVITIKYRSCGKNEIMGDF